MMSTYEYRELSGCNTMGLNCTGSLALIAGRRSYGVINLNKKRKLDKKIRRTTCKYDVSALEFHPFKEELSALSSNDRIELIDWSGLRDMNLIANVKAHLHVLNDLAWHPALRDSLASCGNDSFIHLWDIREIRKPSLTLASVSPAAQIKWEKLPHGGQQLLASAHEGEIKLWDIRHPAQPTFSYTNAHLSKIYSLDFSSIRPGVMVTASQDSTVKVWDLSNTRSPINVIRLPHVPAWKVRFTPFGGDGLVTLTMHTIQRCENNLMLWNINNASVPDSAPEHVFSGHVDMIMEFAWRKSDYFYEDRIHLSDDLEEDNGDEPMSHHQLVTWSKDNSLRIWTLGEKIRSTCGSLEAPQKEEIGREATEDVVRKEAMANSRPFRHSEPIMASSVSSNLDSFVDSIQDESDEEEKVASLPSSSKESLPSYKYQTNLQQEFSLLNFGDRLILEKLDLNERYCIITAETLHHNIALQIKFPLNYPGSGAPSFSFINPTTLDSEIRMQLLRKLKLTAHQQAVKARLCLEMCLRQFETAIENIYQIETESLKNQISSPTDMLGVYQDTNIPFPRTSGARFCGMGQLVCFGFPPTIMIPIENKPVSQSKTPRAMSATNPPPAYYGQTSAMKARRGVRFSRSVSLMGVPPGAIQNSGSRHFQGTKSSISTSSESVPESGYQITIYDVLSISSVSKYLGERCLIADEDTSVSEACSTNASLASSIGRSDIAKTWAIASICAQVHDQNIAQKRQKNGCRSRHIHHSNTVCSCSQKEYNFEFGKYINMELPWAQHPFGRRLLDSLISHYIRQQDLQTAGLLLCNFYEESNAFEAENNNSIDEEVVQPVMNMWDVRRRKNNSKSECSVDTARDIALDILSSASFKKHSRSNSDTQSLDDYAKSFADSLKSSPSEEPQSSKHKASSDPNKEDTMLLDPSKIKLYDEVKGAYAELLLRMGLHSKAIQVRKRRNSVSPQDTSSYIVFTTRQCPSCLRTIRGGNSCRFCSDGGSVSSCSLCQLPCKGVTSVCIYCNHGGHLAHIVKWFQSHDQCPTGCGCKCVAKE